MDSSIRDFDLGRLWPDFGMLLQGNVWSADGLSALICSILIAFFLCFLAYLAWAYVDARKAIAFFSQLVAKYSDRKVAEVRREMRNDAAAVGPRGSLWMEFDESLVESRDGSSLYNVLDASHYFNEETLAANLTDNRLMAAVPSFLTAVGVIGTFAGLQLGLGTVDLAADSDVMRGQIGSLIKGASVAFLTSVWGVGSSLLFNFIEKILEQSALSHLADLQNQIDHLFSKMNAEQSLVRIEDHNKESRETLQGLSERIGAKMQEAVQEVGSQVTDGIATALAPAVQGLVEAAADLADKQAAGSEQALGSLLSSFLEKFGAEGGRQKELMESASGDVKAAIESLGTNMKEFMIRLESQQSAIDDSTRRQSEMLSQQMATLAENQRSQSEAANTHFQSITEQLLAGIDQRQTQSAEREAERLDELAGQVRKMTDMQEQAANAAFEKTTRAAQSFVEEVQDQFIKISETEEKRARVLEEKISQFESNQLAMLVHVDEVFQEHSVATGEVVRMSQSLGETVSSNQEFFQAATASLNSGAQSLADAANGLKELGTNLEKSADYLSRNVTESVISTNLLSERVSELLGSIGEISSSISVARDGMDSASIRLSETAEIAQASFRDLGNHQVEYQRALSEHVEQLEQQLDRILKEYSDQVRTQTIDRLNVWNQQTHEFATTMEKAVRAVSEVVDEIDDKVNGRS